RRIVHCPNDWANGLGIGLGSVQLRSALISPSGEYTVLKQAIALLALGLSACGGYKKALPPVEAPKQPAAPEVFKFSEKARQARLATVVFDLPIGHRYGAAAAGWDGSCHTRQPLVNTKGRFNYDVTKYTDLFSSAMKRHGYSVDEDVELFEGSKERVADLKVGARIIDATLNVCLPNSRNDLEAKGCAYLKVEWSVYSTIDKKLILTTTTEGSTHSEIESTVGEAGILRPAMAEALERLALDPKYRQVVDPPAAT